MNKFLMIASLLFTFAPSAPAAQIRNMKTVISGHVYRAGTTGKAQYNDATLTQLCEDGFTLAVFLYSGATRRTVECSGGRSITYMSIPSYLNIDNVTGPIGSAVRAGGKAIFHCWNGVHATGFIAAGVLNRFCGYSGAQAAEYFVRGVPAGSLPQKNINKLSGILQAQPSGGSVMQGCP